MADMAAQMAEIRRRRAAECAEQRKEEKAAAARGDAAGGGGAGAAAGAPKSSGKVIGGKYFASPPQQLGMKEYEAIVNRYQRIQRQKKATVEKFCLDHESADFFQSFIRMREFKLMRYGVIYGTVQGAVVQGHCIYEPEQHGNETTFTPLEDRRLEKIDKLTELLGLRRVGVITSAPQLALDKPILSAQEVLLCAEQQARFGMHCCLVQMRMDESGTELRVEAYQVSEQCVDIFKEKTLSVHPTSLGVVHSERELEAILEEGSGAKKAMVSKKATHDVDTIWFTVPVPIGTAEQDLFGNRFIRLNRPGQEPPMWQNVRTFLEDPKRRNKPFVQQLSDFHLLVFLTTMEGFCWKSDWPAICAAVRTKDQERAEGFSLMIKSQAGMDF